MGNRGEGRSLEFVDPEVRPELSRVRRTKIPYVRVDGNKFFPRITSDLGDVFHNKLIFINLMDLQAENKYRIAVIPKGTTHIFWKSIHAGANKAAQELKEAGIDVEIIWKGPLKEDDRESQIKVVEGFITLGVSGIVLAPGRHTEAVVAYRTQALPAAGNRRAPASCR